MIPLPFSFYFDFFLVRVVRLKVWNIAVRYRTWSFAHRVFILVVHHLVEVHVPVVTLSVHALI